MFRPWLNILPSGEACARGPCPHGRFCIARADQPSARQPPAMGKAAGGSGASQTTWSAKLNQKWRAKVAERQKRWKADYKCWVAKVVEAHMCPITRRLPIDPVLADDGYMYERGAIEQWLAFNRRSPVTQTAMGKHVTEHTCGRQIIRELVEGRAVDNDTAMTFYLFRAEFRATRLSALGPDIDGAMNDIKMVARLGQTFDAHINFRMKVIKWMIEGTRLSILATTMSDNIQRWIKDVGKSVQIDFNSQLDVPLTNWLDLGAGTLVKLRYAGDVLRRMCYRPPRGARVGVGWDEGKTSFAGEICAVQRMGNPSEKSYVLVHPISGKEARFPYDCVMLMPAGSSLDL